MTAPQPLRVIAFDGGHHLPIWAAQRQGAFEDHGVRVILRFTPSSTAAVAGRRITSRTTGSGGQDAAQRLGCSLDAASRDTRSDAEADPVLPAIEPVVTTDSARESFSSLVVDPGAPQPWRFTVLSDLHLPNPRVATVDRTIEGLIALGVRLVIVTGDHTNGSEGVDHRRSRVKAWWTSVIEALEPLHDAGIAVLPIAGNRDTYLSWQREGYEQAFADLARWAAPFKVNPSTGRGLARSPYSYSLDLDGVHFALAHVVDRRSTATLQPG